jgi:hypothetical protein
MEGGWVSKSYGLAISLHVVLVSTNEISKIFIGDRINSMCRHLEGVIQKVYMGSMKKFILGEV